MLGRLLLAFILIPLVELVLLNQMYQRTNLLTTVVVVLVTGVVGANLAKQQGYKAWHAVHQQMAKGAVPSKEILDGVMILIAGAFLITPGLLTDLTGFLLLVPRVRSIMAKRLGKWFMDRTVVQFNATQWSNGAMDDDLPPQETEGTTATVRVVDPNAPQISTATEENAPS